MVMEMLSIYSSVYIHPEINDLPVFLRDIGKTRHLFPGHTLSASLSPAKLPFLARFFK
jgi:hypothetical protein